MTDQSFCLKWEGYQTNVTSLFDELRLHDELVDITLCCEGHRIGAHRMLLSACSPYFRNVFKETNRCQHMVFYMKDTSASDLRALVEFMYKGSVNVSQNQLASFIRTAKALQIRGLSGEDEQKLDSPVKMPQSPLPSTSVPSSQGRRPNNSSVITETTLQSSSSSSTSAAASGGGGGGGNCSPALKRRRHNSGGVITAPSSSCTTSTSSSGVVDLPAATCTTSASAAFKMSASLERTAHALTDQSGGAAAAVANVDGGDVRAATTPPPSSLPLTSSAGAAWNQDSVARGHCSPLDATSQMSLAEVKVEKVDLTEDSGDDEVDDEMAVATAGDMSSSLETALGQVADYENYDDAGGSALLSSSDFHQQLAMADYSANSDMPGSSQMMPAAADESSNQGYMCCLCGISFRNPMSLSHHRRVHDGSTQCCFCQRVFSRIGVLRRHLSQVHNMSEQDVAATTCSKRNSAGNSSLALPLPLPSHPPSPRSHPPLPPPFNDPPPPPPLNHPPLRFHPPSSPESRRRGCKTKTTR